MSERVPEPIETQARNTRNARNPLADTGGLPVMLGVLFVDAFILVAAWGASASGRQLLMVLVAVDTLLVLGWLIGIPLRRWLYRPPR